MNSRLPHRSPTSLALAVFAALGLAGCDSDSGKPAGQNGSTSAPRGAESARYVDRDLSAAADVSILFIGNSHTTWHDLPNLVRGMMEFKRPSRTVLVRMFPVQFLDEVAGNSELERLFTGRRWTHVVLQAQRISASGKYSYSRQEGIDFARRARATGAAVLFFSEWGRKGVAGDARMNERIYQEMAEASEARVVRVGHVWDVALAERPSLPLHWTDGNHQSTMGAFLTACVLYGAVTGESPEGMEAMRYDGVKEEERRFLAGVAGKSPN